MVKRFSKKYIFSKKYGTIEELSTTCNLKVMSRCLSVPMLHPYITAQEQAAKTNMASVVRIQVFSFMHS